MTPRSAAATDAARCLWARTAGDTRAPEDLAAAAQRMHQEVRVGLGRWIGAGGCVALLDRALGLVRKEHPALEGVSSGGVDESVAAETARAHGAEAVAAGQVALMATLIELLGRIIGEEMAVHLVGQIGVSKPHRVVGSETGGRDG